jgi:DnaJ family protein B protein 4
MTPAEILGIPPESTEAEAKAAYRKLAQIYHPDRPDGDIEKFRQLGAALRQFSRTLPCPVCAGKGFIETRSGLAVKRDRCPKCWNAT